MRRSESPSKAITGSNVSHREEDDIISEATDWVTGSFLLFQV